MPLTVPASVGLTLSDLLTIIAIFLGPIVALFLQRIIDYLREKKERRVRTFVTLMTTRAASLSPEHLNALNSIDVVFHKKPKVRDAWQKLRSHLATDPNQVGWQERQNDLKAILLSEIGKVVGYKFDIDYLKRTKYIIRDIMVT